MAARSVARNLSLLSSRVVNRNEIFRRSAATVAEQVSRVSNEQNANQTLSVPPEYRFVYPEFLPDPDVKRRNKLREKLERDDMLQRRAVIDIPEFYVGSIVGVTIADPNSPSKTNRFVGICIQRGGTGLRAWFILRNVVDNQGIEIMYEMYCPLIQKIEVLRLEKRLDDTLLYLRDALPEYSTFPFDMEPEVLPEGSAVPVNPIKVKLRPRPWLERWERQDLKGLQDLELPQKFYDRAAAVAKPWEKYDLMKQYRATIPAEEQQQIFTEVQSQLQQFELSRRKARKRRNVSNPTGAKQQ
nr:EOG090X0F2L [Eulimnadia texana]